MERRELRAAPGEPSRYNGVPIVLRYVEQEEPAARSYLSEFIATYDRQLLNTAACQGHEHATYGRAHSCF